MDAGHGNQNGRAVSQSGLAECSTGNITRVREGARLWWATFRKTNVNISQLPFRRISTTEVSGIERAPVAPNIRLDSMGTCGRIGGRFLLSSVVLFWGPPGGPPSGPERPDTSSSQGFSAVLPTNDYVLQLAAGVLQMRCSRQLSQIAAGCLFLAVIFSPPLRHLVFLTWFSPPSVSTVAAMRASSWDRRGR